MQSFFVLFGIIFSFQAQALSSDLHSYIREFSLVPNMDLDFKDHDIARQSADFPGSVCFLTAAKLGLESFLKDGSDEESPRFCFMELEGDEDYFYNELNNADNTFGLVTATSPMPMRGESIEENWVFYLKTATLDYSFWAIVDRAGKKATYNYGFN